ncbi:MAG: hypothetical protein ACXIVQ_16420 [Acidimicrobiales bacterium]
MVMNHEETREAGAVFAVLMLGCLAFIVVGTVSEVAGLPYWAGAIVCVVAYYLVRAIGSGLGEWADGRPERAERRPPPVPDLPEFHTPADRERILREKLKRVRSSPPEVRAEYERSLREIDEIRHRRHR